MKVPLALVLWFTSVNVNGAHAGAGATKSAVTFGNTVWFTEVWASHPKAVVAVWTTSTTIGSKLSLSKACVPTELAAGPVPSPQSSVTSSAYMLASKSAISVPAQAAMSDSVKSDTGVWCTVAVTEDSAWHPKGEVMLKPKVNSSSCP